MYLDSCTTRRKGKTYTRHLLRESYREDGKVKHRTIANLSHCSPEEIEAIRLALRHKGELPRMVEERPDLVVRQGPSVGAIYVLTELAARTGVAQALGDSRQGKLALWQVLARVIDQGSRLSAVRLAGSHAACEILGLPRFDEDDLYANLDWLAEHQAEIETRLFQERYAAEAPSLYLYDVTSSYLEGTENELGVFGYNRDGKRGKRQIVIGLLCDAAGTAVSIEVFAGNTNDTKTFAPQIRKVTERFGGGVVTFVGDRGMIRGPQMEDLSAAGMHFITAITKPQIESLLAAGTLQMELFDETLAEVIDTDGHRYVLRRNPARAAEVAASRQDRLQRVRQEVETQNTYLAEHPRARPQTAERKVRAKIQRLALGAWVRLQTDQRRLAVEEDTEALAEASKLDGCYCLKTDLPRETADAETVHDRYKDLSQVEWCFRTCKTTHLEARPIFVRRESRTRGHVFVVMLAYLLVAELARLWRDLDVTVSEGIAELTSVCATELCFGSSDSEPTTYQIPRPRESVARLLAAADIGLPEVLPSSGIHVATKRKLTNRRVTR